MNPLTDFLTAIAMSLLVSTAVVTAMSRPLGRALGALCKSEGDIRFWGTFTAVMLYVTPLMFTMFWYWAGVEPFAIVTVLRSALAMALLGSFAGLLVVGYNIAKSRPG
jgi:hypothetical protein